MANSPQDVFDPQALLAKVGSRGVRQQMRPGTAIYMQGDPAATVYFLQAGRVKITTISGQGKEAVVAILTAGDFFGEGCLAGQTVRIATATALVDSTVIGLDMAAVAEVLHQDTAFTETFMAHLLARNIRMEADLIDQLFNSSEKRLARLLLLLANYGKEGTPQPLVIKLSQETLAEMIGTTRSRVSHFMNKFRRLGYIAYNGHIEVHSSLLSVVLKDDLHNFHTPHEDDADDLEA